MRDVNVAAVGGIAQGRPVTPGLVLLVTPTDRCHDAPRLAEAGFRVIATSIAASSARQMLEARPAIIVVELMPSLVHDALRLLSQITLATHIRHVPVIVYGTSATQADCDAITALGARWLPLPTSDRTELVAEVRQSLFTPVEASPVDKLPPYGT